MQKPRRAMLSKVIILIVSTFLAFFLYRLPIEYGQKTQNTKPAFVVMVTYLALLLGFTLAYLIYNRFFYRHGVTEAQLPPEWSEKQKQEFLDDVPTRMKKSNWMLLIIFPLVFTFLIDAIDLFLLGLLFGR